MYFFCICKVDVNKMEIFFNNLKKRKMYSIIIYILLREYLLGLKIKIAHKINIIIIEYNLKVR